ncbi:hypothetical protein Tco_1123027 [Tanacetum coccineum]|uniref:Uncharacterized protein n=1 Tax=Tanacetum coccineum TaxID=301880 RepID=A0ABQ5J263_9ASTR
MAEGVDNRRITLIVIRARANSAVVVSLMEFVLVVLMEMEIKSIFQLRTLLINLQFIYPEPDYSPDFNSPQDLHNLQQQNLCCENCRDPHATIECQPMSQNSHSFGFDQLQTPQFSVNHQPPQPMSMEALQAQEDLMKSIESFLKKFNRISFGKTPKVLLQAWDNFFEVKHAQSEEVQELLSKLVQDVKIISDELSEYINTPAWNRPLDCDNDDDEDYTIAITPESPTKEPVNSLSLKIEEVNLTRKVISVFGKFCSTITLACDPPEALKPFSMLRISPSHLISPLRIMYLYGGDDLFLAMTDPYHHYWRWMMSTP